MNFVSQHRKHPAPLEDSLPSNLGNSIIGSLTCEQFPKPAHRPDGLVRQPESTQRRHADEQAPKLRKRPACHAVPVRTGPGSVFGEGAPQFYPAKQKLEVGLSVWAQKFEFSGAQGYGV